MTLKLVTFIAYAPFASDETAKSWAKETVVIESSSPETSLESLISAIDNKNTNATDGHAILHVLPRSSGLISLVINAPHAVIDLSSSANVWQTLVDEIANDSTETIAWGDEVVRLPRSIGNVLSEAYPQGTIAWGKTVIGATKSMASVTSVSVLSLCPLYFSIN